MTLDMTTVVARQAGALTAPVDDEIVILNPGRDNYLGLDHIGRAVWDLIESPCRLSDLCARLSETFDSTPDEIAPDAVVFLTEMTEEGVVHVVDE